MNNLGLVSPRSVFFDLPVYWIQENTTRINELEY
jgi:hypothetical protein